MLYGLDAGAGTSAGGISLGSGGGSANSYIQSVAQFTDNITLVANVELAGTTMSNVGIGFSNFLIENISTNQTNSFIASATRN